MSQAYMFKHNVDIARKYAYSLSLIFIYCIFERFTDLLFLNEYTHMRKCVCLDTRLKVGISPGKIFLFPPWILRVSNTGHFSVRTKAAIPCFIIQIWIRFRICVRKILMRTPYSRNEYPSNVSSYFYLFKDAGTDTDAYTDTDDRNSSTIFNLFQFYPDTDVWILILIRRHGIAA